MRSAMIASEDVYRRLGYQSDIVPDAVICQKVNETTNFLVSKATPRTIKKEFNRRELASLLTGKDIEKHLISCHHCLLLAATLGLQIDTLIRRISVSDMNEALIMDAIASVYIEAVMEKFETEVREEYVQRGRYITSRFSPGYGDFPMMVQNEFLHLLDAGRMIGLHATPTHILIPRKSITAVCGVSTQFVTGSLTGCDNCRLNAACQNGKEGKTCGK